MGTGVYPGEGEMWAVWGSQGGQVLSVSRATGVCPRGRDVNHLEFSRGTGVCPRGSNMGCPGFSRGDRCLSWEEQCGPSGVLKGGRCLSLGGVMWAVPGFLRETDVCPGESVWVLKGTAS